MTMTRRTVTTAGGAAFLVGCSGASTTGAGSERAPRPLVIAHRGASADRPEHTRGAYQLGINQGANFIEPDLVMTKDGVLVCRHECEIGETTDVASRPEFADRRATKTIDGESFTGWFAEDFTLAELKTLRCKERLPQLRPQNMAYDGQETIPTFAEAAALANAAGVGIYPELKHPTYLTAVGLDPVPALMEALRAADLAMARERVFVQCFELGPLQRIASVSSMQVACIQLISAEGAPVDGEGLTYADLITDEGLGRIADYAVGIGVQKTLITPWNPEDGLSAPTDLVARAHAAGLKVHAWTVRPENYFLPVEMRRGDDLAAPGDVAAEIRLLLDQGVDGLFCDRPSDAVAVLADWSAPA